MREEHAARRDVHAAPARVRGRVRRGGRAVVVLVVHSLVAAVDDVDVHGVAQRKDAKPDVAPRSCDRILIDVPELPGRAERREHEDELHQRADLRHYRIAEVAHLPPPRAVVALRAMERCFEDARECRLARLRVGEFFFTRSRI